MGKSSVSVVGIARVDCTIASLASGACVVVGVDVSVEQLGVFVSVIIFRQPTNNAPRSNRQTARYASHSLCSLGSDKASLHRLNNEVSETVACRDHRAGDYL